MVVIDIWATWCGPCRAGHKAMKSMKEEMKGENIQFVYITSPSSPLATWQEMIKEIDGDHYYLTKEQYNYILDKYESDGIPTYAIYDPQGKMTFKKIGYPDVNQFKKEIEKGNFREDLYHRLSVIVIQVPSLDERKDDIPQLVDYFVQQISTESGMPVRKFSDEAIKMLQGMSWTGNIRELRNVVERLMILGGNPVSAQDVKDYVSPIQ